jgi:hypothetical protein
MLRLLVDFGFANCSPEGKGKKLVQNRQTSDGRERPLIHRTKSNNFRFAWKDPLIPRVDTR